MTFIATGFACPSNSAWAGALPDVVLSINLWVMTRNKLTCRGWVFLLLLPAAGRSQPSENVYRATSAEILTISDSSARSHTVKGATAVLDRNSREILFSVVLPQAVFDSQYSVGSMPSESFYPFRLRFPVSWPDILDNLTSSKTYCVTGLLSLNSLQKPVAVTYIPMPSGNESSGRVDLFLVMSFDPHLFCIPSSPGQVFRLTVSRAFINSF